MPEQTTLSTLTAKWRAAAAPLEFHGEEYDSAEEEAQDSMSRVYRECADDLEALAPAAPSEVRTPADLVAAIKANIDTLAGPLAYMMANLGGKVEWDMDDNFYTTERLAELAGQITGHAAGGQSKDDLRFWHPIATALGCDPDDYEYDNECEEGGHENDDNPGRPICRTCADDPAVLALYCEGHESLAGEHMGETVQCDGTCLGR